MSRKFLVPILTPQVIGSGTGSSLLLGANNWMPFSDGQNYYGASQHNFRNTGGTGLAAITGAGQITVTAAAPTAADHLTRKDYVDSRTTTPLGSVVASASGVITDVNTVSGGARTVQTVTIGTFTVPVIVAINVSLRGGNSGGDATFGASAVHIASATSFGDLNMSFWARAGSWAGVPLTGSYYLAIGADPSFRIDFNGFNFGGGTCHTGGNYSYTAVRWT